MQITINSRQSLFDILIQGCGGIENILSVAFRNGLSLTDDLRIGQQIEINTGEITCKQVVSYLAARQIKPATALTQAAAEISPGGVGYMAVGIDFIVS